MTQRPPARVIVGGTYWTLNGVNVFSANLVRGLRARGIDAEILLTEEHTDLISINDAPMARPDDVPMTALPVEPWQSWGRHWGAMIRYLEERAPCVYIPNSDWRHSSVCPLLSSGVHVIGVVHSDDPLHYDHVRRLGRYWDAIVTTSATIKRKTLALDASLRTRTTVIPIGVDIPRKPMRRPARRREPLRVIYPGTLKQHQKRVLDLPRIVEAAAQRGVPLRLTIAGGGPDEAELRRACAPLVERGLIDFAGMVEHSALLRLLEAHDVFIMTSEFEGMPNALLEAMGRGCVPLATDIESGIPDLVKDGANGYLVGVGDIDAFAHKLEHLATHDRQRRDMSRRAFEAVSAGKYRVDDMVDSYAALCARVTKRSGRAFVRPRGRMSHPPPEIGGVGLFPIPLGYRDPVCGAFPARTPDYGEFSEEILAMATPTASHLYPRIRRQRTSLLKRLTNVPVIVTSPAWVEGGVNDFALALVRQLRAYGVSAHILLTEQDTSLVDRADPLAPLPDDVPFERLPVARDASWSAHWGAMIRYLEDRAPCIFVPNDDWRHSCVSPLLSDRVAIVGVAHGDDPLHDNHVRRLGRYWNAVVAFAPAVEARLAQDAELAGRTHFVPYQPKRAALDFLDVFSRVLRERDAATFRRPDGVLQPPPSRVGGVDIFPVDLPFSVSASDTEAGSAGPILVSAQREFRAQLRGMRDPARSRVGAIVERRSRGASALTGVKVVIASPAWHENGVNHFSEVLARELIAAGVAAEIVLTEEDTALVTYNDPLHLHPTDVPITRLPIDRTGGWGAHWGAMIRFLEDRAPCVYLPNHDWRHSCVSPLLSPHVAIAGIVHQDTPVYREHTARLGRYWNAIVTYDVGTGKAISQDPELGPHTYVLTYRLHGAAEDYIDLFAGLIDDVNAGRFVRPRGTLRPPPRDVDGMGIFGADLPYAVNAVGPFASADDYREFTAQASSRIRSKHRRSHTV